MVTLDLFPKNKEKFLQLIQFCDEVLEICKDLGISPILNGSLAVFAYTKNGEMNVNDVDLACSEREFPTIISALEERGINYKWKPWHVLQILKDDLKVEFDSIEYWYKDLSMAGETLQIDNYTINMLSLKTLKEVYKRGVNDTTGKTEANDKTKHAALKAKYEALEKVKD